MWRFAAKLWQKLLEDTNVVNALTFRKWN